MAKITSAKTVIDNNKLFTSQINDDNTRQFNEYDITLQDIQTKQLDFTVDVTPIDDKLEKLTVSFDGDKFIGMDIRNREVYNFQATTPYNLDVSNQIGTFERPVRKIVLLGPDDGLRVPTVNPTLEWRADSSAEGYRVEVSANGFVSNVYSAEVSGTTHTVSSNLAFDTTYEWRVAGTNKGGVGEYSDPRSFITRIGNTGAVTLLTPTNGDDIVNVTPTFSWSADANAVSYQIQISTNNFASTVIDTTTFNTNFSTTLVHDQTYQWRVRAINEFSTSVWSTVWTFQVESNVVGNVSLSSPSNGQTGVSIPTTLSWGGATNATSYDVQVSTNNFVSFVYNDNTTSTSVSIPGLGFNTDYQWRVRGVNRTNVGSYTSRSFETRIGDVGSLTLTAPSNGQTISSTSQTFTWNAVTNATIYDIQISTNNFASYIVNTSTSSTSYSYSPFSLGTTYQWRVRARNAYSTGGYVSRSFSVFSPSLSLSRSSASFGDNGGSVTFSVTSNTTWTITDNRSWISTSGADGSGNDSSVTINVTSNGSTSSRSGTVTVQTTDGSVTRTISVNQAGQPAPTATPTPTPVPPGLSYDNISVSVASQDAAPIGITFNNNGTKLFMSGGSSDTIYQYSCSSPYNITGLSYDNISFNVGPQDGTPYNVYFSPNGTKMFILGANNRTVYQYTLSSGFNLSTASYDNISFNITNDISELQPRGFTFSPDGSKFFVQGIDTDSIHQWTCSNDFNVSSPTYNGSTGVPDGTSRGIEFNNNGTKIFVLGDNSDKITEIILPIPYNVASGGFIAGGVFLPSAINNPMDMAFNGDGSKLFIISLATDSIHQFSTPSPFNID